MPSVLFIDQDSATLNAVVRNYNMGNFGYELIPMEDPEFAFQKILQNDVMAVVSEISMEGFLCKTFYEELIAVKPEIVRISLTTDMNLMQSFNDKGQTHITFNKPINTSLFLNWLNELLYYRESADKDLIVNFFENVELKSYPENILRIVAMLNNKNFDMKELVSAINQDTNLKVRLLKFVNSASFGFTRQISDIKEAVEYLGVNNINSVIKFLNVFSIFDKKTTTPDSVKVVDFLHDKRIVNRSELMDLKFALNLKDFICEKFIGINTKTLDASSALIMHILMISKDICDAVYYTNAPDTSPEDNKLLNVIVLCDYLCGEEKNEEFLFDKVGKDKVLTLKNELPSCK